MSYYYFSAAGPGTPPVYPKPTPTTSLPRPSTRSALKFTPGHASDADSVKTEDFEYKFKVRMIIIFNNCFTLPNTTEFFCFFWFSFTYRSFCKLDSFLTWKNATSMSGFEATAVRNKWFDVIVLNHSATDTHYNIVTSCAELAAMPYWQCQINTWPDSSNIFYPCDQCRPRSAVNTSVLSDTGLHSECSLFSQYTHVYLEIFPKKCWIVSCTLKDGHYPFKIISVAEVKMEKTSY
jgi:hypothetical protein